MAPNIKLLFTIALLGHVPWSVAGQDADEPRGLQEQSVYLGIRSSYQSCIDHSDGSMPSMTECAESEFAYQDKRLNAIYARVMRSRSADQRSILRAEERAWIARKDAECAIPEARGQGQILDSTGCTITETARRARQLEHLPVK